jgi:transposase-like protein
VARGGHDDWQRERQRYRCTTCQVRFDDLTDTLFNARCRGKALLGTLLAALLPTTLTPG